MLDKNNLVQWQTIDPSNGYVYPWFTHGCLEWMSQQDWSNKKVMEWGGGFSTLWWAEKAYYVYSVEANQTWHRHVSETLELLDLNKKCTIELKAVNEGDQSQVSYYCAIPNDNWDVFVVDGILRYECILAVIERNKPCTLIVDNWQQSYVFMCPAAEVALSGYERYIFEQVDHTDNDGINKWKTAVFFIEPK